MLRESTPECPARMVGTTGLIRSVPAQVDVVNPVAIEVIAHKAGAGVPAPPAMPVSPAKATTGSVPPSPCQVLVHVNSTGENGP